MKNERGTEMTARENAIIHASEAVKTAVDNYANIGQASGFFANETLTLEMCDESLRRRTAELITIQNTTEEQYEAMRASIRAEE